MTIAPHHPGNQLRRVASRRGALLLELVAAVALFSVTLTLAVPVVTAVAAIREQSQCRQLANIELGNVMERIAARHRAGEAVSAAASSTTLNPATAEVLDAAQLSIAVAGWDDVPQGVHVTASLTWQNGEGLPAAPAELHAFFVDPTAPETLP
ncbi:MAG: hypothetical protein JNG89_07065 [Planctomycetaceae bacterium]|nr:hypothetical protein [Planctomycetaceae bacterium]